MHLRRIFLLCLLSVTLMTANASTESAEADDEDSTEPAVVLPADDSTTEKISNVGDDAADPPQVPVAVKAVKIGGEGEEGDDDDDDEGDDGGEEEGCDMRLSSVVRNIDGSPFLPDDYEAAYDSVTKTDWANKHYNITDMMAIIQSVIDHGVKVSKNKDLADTAMYVSSVMMDRLYDAKVSAECTADLANIGSSLRSGQLWPVKFIDSMAMPPSGMMTVHISALGEYDQCLGIRSPVLENGRRIYGQYCQMEARSIIPKTKTSTRYAETVFLDNTYIRQALEFVRSQMKMSNFLDEEAYLVRMMKEMLDWIDKDVCFFHVGLCVPASCSPQELEMVINQIIYPILKLPFRIAYCEKHPDITETKLDRVQWIAIIVLGAVSTLALISTLYHLYLICVRDPKSVQKVLLKSSGTSANTNDNKEGCSKSSGVNLCLNLEGSRAELKPVRSICQQFAITFSVVHNTKKLLSPEKTSFMGLVHAVQLLFTFLLFASQSFTFGLLVTPQLLRNWVNTVPYQLVSDDRYWFARMPSVWVDGLVFITGVSIVLRQAEFFQTHSSRSFGYFAYFWRHWFRHSVPMFGALLLLFLLPLTGNGPFFYLNRNWLWPACTRTPSLVSSFLYYSNWNQALDDYTIKDEFPVCNPPTWYFSASMQLIMLAPLVFLPLLRRPKLGLTLLLALLLLLGPLGTLAPYLISGRPTFLELTSHTSLTSMYAAYHQYTSSTGQYITSLLIGLLSGYLLVEKRRNGGWAALSGKTALQVLLSILSLVVIGLVFAWNNTFWVFNENFSTTSALAWYVSSKFLFTGAVACLTYIAAIANTGTLKHLLRLVEPIGKLSTSILMLSVLTTLYRLTTHRHTYEMYFFQTIQNTIFDFVITTFVAFLLHLLFEGPAMRLAEIFESDQLFAGSMQGTGSFEELKPKNSRSSSEDSGEKSIEAVENTPAELKVGHSA